MFEIHKYTQNTYIYTHINTLTIQNAEEWYKAIKTPIYCSWE